MRRGASYWILLIAIVVVGGVFFAIKKGELFASREAKPIEGTVAQRGTLLISETVRGNLKAKDSLSLRNEIEGRTTIISLVDEGAIVEAGDLVAEVDTSELKDRLVVQKIAEQNSAADYTKAREQLAIQRIQNESDIAAAELALSFARMDLEKYTIEDGEWTHELKKAEETIKLSEEELTRAQARLDWTQKLYDQGFVQGLELEADRATVERAKVNVEQARRDKALKEQYGHRRQLEELQAAVETKGRDLQKTQKQASARLADFQAGEASAQIRWDLEKEKLRKIESQLDKGRIVAPIRGMVVYARESSRWGSSEPVQEGKEVREREEIVTIPREGGMIVDASLHETVLKKVKLGQPCKITIDALPTYAFQGRVQFVAVLADSNAWFANPNQRVYRSEISIENGISEMRPGMSCSVEILVAELQDVVHVPVQCVLMDGGETIVFVKKGADIERRAVEVGLDNSKQVEVKNGLEAGELVLLTPPASFKPKPAPAPTAEDVPEELRMQLQGGGNMAGGAPQGFPGGMPGGEGMRGAGGPAGGEGMRGGFNRGNFDPSARGGEGRPSGRGGEDGGADRQRGNGGNPSGGGSSRRSGGEGRAGDNGGGAPAEGRSSEAGSQR